MASKGGGVMEKYRLDPDTETMKCPVCEKSVVGDFDVCPVCGWENDYGQRAFPNVREGANKMSLNEARKAWKEGKRIY